MIRYFYLIGLWIGCFILSTVDGALAASTTGMSGSSKPAFTPTEDWELPSFVAKTSGEEENAPASAHKRHHNSFTVKEISSNHVAASSTEPSRSHDTASTTESSRKHEVAPITEPSRKHEVASSSEPSHAAQAPAPAKPSITRVITSSVVSTALAAKKTLADGGNALMGRLARVTAYWEGEGDYYTGRGVSATGVHLHGGHCAVDPSIIPYGSVVVIPGVGQFLAVDTGSAVVSRTAAREAGHTLAERSALVIDLFFEHERDGERFAATGPKYASISWWTPSSTSPAAQAARSVFADENWNKIYSKQL